MFILFQLALIKINVIIRFMVKNCKKCGKEKDSGEFNKRKAARDGLQSYCKSCVSKNSSGRQGRLSRKKANSKYYLSKTQAVAAPTVVAPHDDGPTDVIITGLSPITLQAAKTPIFIPGNEPVNVTATMSSCFKRAL